MVDGELIAGIESRNEGMQPPPLIRRRGQNGTGDDLVGQRIPVHPCIVGEHEIRLLWFRDAPHLGDGQTRQHHIADAVFVHLLEECLDALALLEKVDVVQVRIPIGPMVLGNHRAPKQAQRGNTGG
jgi:hypothetical protein